MTKKLFIARIELEFAFLGDSSFDAGSFIDDALRDSDGHDATVTEVAFTKEGHAIPPEGWDAGCLVYCDGEEDITFGEAAEAEKARRHDEAMARLQTDLFKERS